MIQLLPSRATAAAGLDLQGLRQPGLLCIRGSSLQACIPLLEKSQSFKRVAEQRNLLRCYTALLGLESLLIGSSISGVAAAIPLNRGYREAESACGSSIGADFLVDAR